MVDVIECSISEYVEVDPSERFGRYHEIISEGPSKTVYRAFDEYNGIEVAWIKAKLSDSPQNAEEFERLHCKMNSLKALKHQNIAKFHTSWIDSSNQIINIVTEIFTSGSLKLFKQKHKKVSIKAVKKWCKQILQGLVYLHTRNPSVIHKDLQSENIFVNGNNGELKIGNIGLSEILQKPSYLGSYTELEDVYAFGMCVVEMYTGTQTSKNGEAADALGIIDDPEVKNFAGKCLAELPYRFSAVELLNDYFLSSDDSDAASAPLDLVNLDVMGCGYMHCYEYCDDEDDCFGGEVSIKGKRAEDGTIRLELRIVDEVGKARNIHFRFEVENDTALTVATEMVAELNMKQDVVEIADLIDGEIASLIPGWLSHTDTDTDTDTGADTSWDAGNTSSLENGKPNRSSCDCSECDGGANGEENDALRSMRWMRGLYRLQMRELEDGGRRLDDDVAKLCYGGHGPMKWAYRATSLPVDAIGLMTIDKWCDG